MKKLSDFFSDLKNLVLALGTLLGVALIAYLIIARHIIPNPNDAEPLTVQNVTLSKVTEISSDALGSIKGLCYAFDATGNRIVDFKKPPSRVGYVVEYSGMAQGLGHVEVDYWVQDVQSKNILTGSTMVEAEAVIKNEPIGCEFFIQKALASPKETVFINVVALPVKGSDVDKTIDTVQVDVSSTDVLSGKVALR